MINLAKEKMENSMLVAIRYNENKVLCKFIPKEATQIQSIISEGNVILTYKSGNTHVKQDLNTQILKVVVLLPLGP